MVLFCRSSGPRHPAINRTPERHLSLNPGSTATAQTGAKKVILSGMRPTGRLHWGNYTGALENWIRLQEEYTCHFMVADWHVLTTALDKAPEIRQNSREMYLDWLGAGLDPEKSVLFIQSQVKEHAELYLLLSMLISMGRLERNPTFKEQIRDLNLGGEISYGHLGYPVLQAADILMYLAHAVPVGEDQLPHLELTREMARRFNRIFGDVFPEPEPLVTKFARFPGTDGKRMSKSLGNTIEISATPEEIRKKIKPAFTDPAAAAPHPIPATRRSAPSTPGTRSSCPRPPTRPPANAARAARGCVDCKMKLADGVIEHFAPLRERRAEFENDPGRLDEIIANGCQRARAEAARTMTAVHDAMGIG